MINRTLLVLAASLATSSAAAQLVPINRDPAPAPPPAAPALGAVAPGPPARMRATIPEGTEVHVHLGDHLSSATSTVGDTFVIISDEEITTADGATIPAGYTGRGEVTVAERNGMLGKSGQLGVRLDYLKVGAARIHLRANKAGEGASGVTNTVVLTVLFGPLGLLVHGHSIVYPKGTQITAYVDQDTPIDLPVPPPPVVD
jgi:hypothetical protein